MTTSEQAITGTPDGSWGLLDKLTPEQRTMMKNPSKQRSLDSFTVGSLVIGGILVGGPIGALVGWGLGKTLLGLGVGAVLGGAAGGLVGSDVFVPELDAEYKAL